MTRDDLPPKAPLHAVRIVPPLPDDLDEADMAALDEIESRMPSLHELMEMAIKRPEHEGRWKGDR